jgi:hypothetical protein
MQCFKDLVEAGARPREIPCAGMPILQCSHHEAGATCGRITVCCA